MYGMEIDVMGVSCTLEIDVLEQCVDCRVNC